MSLEELQSDYAAVQAKIDGLNAALTTSPELVSLLRNDLAPLMGAMIKEVAEIDEAMSDIYAEAEDILQPETSGLFATLIFKGRPLVALLLKSAKESKNAALEAECRAWLEIGKAAESVLEEITVPEGDEDDDDDDDDDDEDADNDNKAKTEKEDK